MCTSLHRAGRPRVVAVSAVSSMYMRMWLSVLDASQTKLVKES